VILLFIFPLRGGIMRVDSQVVLAAVLLIYALFLGVGAANLYSAGYLRTSQSFEVVASAIYVGLLSLAYVLYHAVYDRSSAIMSYEHADLRKSLFWALVVAVFLYAVYLWAPFMPFSSTYVQTLLNLVYVAPLFIALAEDMGLIAVVGDYVYSQTGNALTASAAVGLTAMVLHSTTPLIIPHFSLLVVFLQFFLWTYASIQSRSTLPADITHVLNNALFLIGV